MMAELPDITDMVNVAFPAALPPFDWQQFGIFPTQECLDEGCLDTEHRVPWQWSSFNYTAGLLPDLDLWMPCVSVEGRYMGNELTGMYLNLVAILWKCEALAPGMSFTFTVGTPDGDDMTAVGWIADEPVHYSVVQANYSRAENVYRILWSSPLGWES